MALDIIKLGLQSLYYRRVRGNIIEIYKGTHGKYIVVAEYIKMDTDSRGRRHEYRLKKHVTDTWNILPADVIDVLELFKVRINKHWCQYKYSLFSEQEPYNATSWLIKASI